MHYYKFHIGDFRGATTHLTNEEELAYRRLLDWYYDTESPIPLDTQMVSRRLRVGCESVDTVLGDFFQKTEDGWTNSRCQDELESYHVKADANRENGKKGGRPKGKNKTQKNPVANQSEPSGNPSESESNLNQEPLTTNQEPIEDQEPLSTRSTRSSRKTKIPDPFMLTAEMRAWASDAAPAVNLKSETETFVDYWRGEAKTKADWPATWRNWIRRAQVDMSKPARRGASGSFNKQEAIEANNQRVVKEIEAQEAARKAGLGQQNGFDLGDSVVIEGEVIHAD